MIESRIHLADEAARWAVRRGLWHDYDEACAEARLLLVEVVATYQGEDDAALDRFLSVRLRQRLIDRWRKGEMGDRRRAPEPISTSELPDVLEPSAETVLLNEHDAERWTCALRSLPPNLRRVVLASCQYGGAMRLAEEWGVPPCRISQLRRMAVKRLRQAVAA